MTRRRLLPLLFLAACSGGRGGSELPSDPGDPPVGPAVQFELAATYQDGRSGLWRGRLSGAGLDDDGALGARLIAIAEGFQGSGRIQIQLVFPSSDLATWPGAEFPEGSVAYPSLAWWWDELGARYTAAGCYHPGRVRVVEVQPDRLVRGVLEDLTIPLESDWSYSGSRCIQAPRWVRLTGTFEFHVPEAR